MSTLSNKVAKSYNCTTVIWLFLAHYTTILDICIRDFWGFEIQKIYRVAWTWNLIFSIRAQNWSQEILLCLTFQSFETWKKENNSWNFFLSIKRHQVKYDSCLFVPYNTLLQINFNRNPTSCLLYLTKLQKAIIVRQ